MMLLKPLALAATAAAILIVPETTEAEDGVFRTLPIDVGTFEVPATAFSQSIDVPCSQCRGRDTTLKMDFTIVEHRLLLNGFELYPNADPWNGDLSAPVVRGNGMGRDRKLGYGLAVLPEGMDEEQHLEVIGVELHVIEVGDRFVDGIPAIKVKLIKAPVGEIIIGSIEMNGVPNNGMDGCSSMWCRAKGLAHKTWKDIKGGFKGCPGMRGHGHGRIPKPHHGHGKPEHAQGAHHGERPHGHHGDGEHHKGGHRSWSRILKHITSYIFIPVLMGITAGVGVAVLAMFIGTIVLRLVRFCKGEQPEPALGAIHKASIVEIVAVDEKLGLMDEEDEPRN